MDKDESQASWMRKFVSKAGQKSRVVASKTVQGSKVVGGRTANATGAVVERTVQGAQAARPHVERAADVAREQASSAAALAAQKTRQHMPRHEPGEPVRPAVLEMDATPVRVAVDEVGDPQALALLSSQFLLADFIASREQDEQRWERMERVLDRQHLALDEAGVGADGAAAILVAFGEGLPVTDRIAFLVDLYFLDPFAPYTLKSDKHARMAGLRRIAHLVGGDEDIVDRIQSTRRSALAAHTKHSLGKIGLIGIGAAVALGVAGFLAAPLVGAAIGTAAGLSGAAAASHGLAILGGGALAAGGAGMAGGMWLVTGVGVTAGLLAAGGGTALYELGSATARGELVKLQITFKLGLLDASQDMAKAQRAITNLVAQADATRRVLDEERKLNDDNAQRVKDLESTLTDIEEAVTWMQRERTAAVASAS